MSVLCTEKLNKNLYKLGGTSANRASSFAFGWRKFCIKIKQNKFIF